MNVDPFAPSLLIDYDHFCRRYGHLDFGEFMALWHAADVLMAAGLELGYEPHRVPELLITTTSPHITFIRESRENGRAGLENGSGGLENSCRDIN
jgi:hypothetical protein